MSTMGIYFEVMVMVMLSFAIIYLEYCRRQMQLRELEHQMLLAHHGILTEEKQEDVMFA